jgi:plasmid maintenance system antidote protein VapI
MNDMSKTNNVIKHFEKILKNRDLEEVRTTLGLSEDEFDLITEGEMAISPELAIKIGTLTNSDPLDLLTAQNEDALVKSKLRRPGARPRSNRHSRARRSPRTMRANRHVSNRIVLPSAFLALGFML